MFVLSTGNLYYFLLAVPILMTFGPATVGMTQVMRKFCLEQPIFVFDEFWSSFKKNFRQGVIIGIFDIIFIASFSFAYIYYDTLTIIDPSFGNIALMAATISAATLICFMHFYIYPQIAALTLTLNQIIKNSFLFAVLGLKGNVISFLVGVVLMLGLLFSFPFSVFLMPFVPFAIICFTATFNAYPVITKYIITPYYESKGEKNPEIPEYMHEAEEEKEEEKPLFEDMGGREAEIKPKPKPRGRVIK